MFIFNNIFRLASLANQDTSNLIYLQIQMFKLFHFIYLKKILCNFKTFRRYATNYSTSNPLH